MSIQQKRAERLVNLTSDFPPIQKIDKGRPAPSASIVRVDLQRTPAKLQSSLEAPRAVQPHVMPTQKIELVGFRIVSGAIFDCLLFVR